MNEEVTAISEEEWKAEALRRMKEMDFIPEVLNSFMRDGSIWISESPLSTLYVLEDGYTYEKEVREILAEFKRCNAGRPYHVIRTVTNIGTMYSVLYVSNWKEEWNTEGMGDDGEIIAGVYNVEMGNQGFDFGCIWVRPLFGGLCRVA